MVVENHQRIVLEKEKKKNNKGAPPPPWSIGVWNIRPFFFHDRHRNKSCRGERRHTLQYFCLWMGRAQGHNRTNTRNITPWCQNTSGNCRSWPRYCCTYSAGAAADALNLKPSPAEDFRLAPSISAQASHVKNLHFHMLLPAFICLLYLPPGTFERCPMVGVVLHVCIWVGAHSFPPHQTLSCIEAPQWAASRTQRAPDFLMNAQMFGYVGHICFVFVMNFPSHVFITRASSTQSQGTAALILFCSNEISS